MKSSTLSLAALICAAPLLCGGAAFAFNLNGYKAQKAATLNIPIVPDSVQKENPFSADKLLNSRLPLSIREQTQDWTTMTPDSTGRLNLVRPTDKPTIQTFTTRLRAPRFTKGKLKLSSTSMGEILLNGKSVAKKTTNDSISKDVSGSVSLNPDADYMLQVNILSMPDQKGDPQFKVEFIPEKEFEDINVEQGWDLGRRFATIQTMVGERASGTALSPDGKYAIVRFTERLSLKEWAYRTILQETASGKTIASDLPKGAQWMPKSNTIYWTVKKNNAFDIHTKQIPNGEETILATGVPNGDFTFAPDTKTLFYYDNVEGSKDTGIMRRVKGPDDRIPGDRDRNYIVRYDLETRTSTPLTYGGASTSICDFSRDGKKMLYQSSVNRPSEYPFYFNTFVEMDLETLKSDTIIRNNPYVSGAIYSPDAKQLFLTGSPSAFDGIGLNIGKEEIANDFDLQGYIYNLADGKVRAMTRDFDPTIEAGQIWNAADNKIYFRGETGFDMNIYSMNPVDGKITKLSTQMPVVASFSIGDNESQWLTYIGGSYTNAGVPYALNLKNGKERQIANPMKAELNGVEFGKTSQWKFTAKDGSVIDGYSCLPPDFDPNKKYPLIVYYYGGTSPSAQQITNPYSPQVFASRGYVVYVLNPSGTTGYGQEFSARHVNAWGKRTADEIIEGVKKFMDAHPFVDRKKVGCLGASYGGFMTQYLQTKTDIFAAAVSHAGISNVTSYWGEGFWGYSYDAVAAAKSYPWNNPELYTKQGSLFNADKIKTPLLLLHGTEDTNVPIGESIQIFNALRILGRDVEFVTVEGANHVVTEFDKRLVWQDTIMAWFAKYLQDDPRWWNELYK